MDCQKHGYCQECLVLVLYTPHKQLHDAVADALMCILEAVVSDLDNMRMDI